MQSKIFEDIEFLAKLLVQVVYASFCYSEPMIFLADKGTIRVSEPLQNAD